VVMCVNEVAARASLLGVTYLTNPNEIYKYFIFKHVSHIGFECCRDRVRVRVSVNT
jgi:hypothetical protein